MYQDIEQIRVITTKIHILIFKYKVRSNKVMRYRGHTRYLWGQIVTSL